MIRLRCSGCLFVYEEKGVEIFEEFRRSIVGEKVEKSQTRKSTFGPVVQSNWELLAHQRRYQTGDRMLSQGTVNYADQFGCAVEFGSCTVSHAVSGRCDPLDETVSMDFD